MGQAFRRRKALGDAYGVGRDFISLSKDELRKEFLALLPRNIGEPHVVNTAEHPYIFAAFYDAKDHELAGGAVTCGCEFRIWDTKVRATKPRLLAGIVGFHSNFYGSIAVTALNEQGTKAKHLNQYTDCIQEMLVAAMG